MTESRIRLRGWGRERACIGCDNTTDRQIQMLAGVWLYVCPRCDTPDSTLADHLRGLSR